MTKVVYVASSGDQHTVDAELGDTVMSAAVRNGVPGIIGECGGNASCATCHVWVREEFRDAVGGPEGLEDDLLDLGVSDRRAGSRLGCQVRVTAEIDGLVVDLPDLQP